MALRKIRLSSRDPEADVSLDVYEIPDGGLREIEHAGRRFRFSHLEMATDGTPEEATLLYTEIVDL